MVLATNLGFPRVGAKREAIGFFEPAGNADRYGDHGYPESIQEYSHRIRAQSRRCVSKPGSSFGRRQSSSYAAVAAQCGDRKDL